MIYLSTIYITFLGSDLGEITKSFKQSHTVKSYSVSNLLVIEKEIPLVDDSQ